MSYVELENQKEIIRRLRIMLWRLGIPLEELSNKNIMKENYLDLLCFVK